MLKNYLTIALRNVRREKGYSLLNIFGLAVGMACCLVILLYVREEVGYDRFHENADRIARLVRETSAMSAAPMGPALVEDLPAVEAAVRIAKLDEVVVERSDGTTFREELFAADSALFDVFSFPLLRGYPRTALARPDGLVLSEAAATKYFGTDDPMGRSLTIHGDETLTFTITGILRDVPAASHLDFSLLATFKLVEAFSNRIENWQTNWLYTYLLLLERGDATGELQAALPAFFQSRVGEAWSHFRIQPLEDVHLHSAHLGYDIAPQGDARQVLLFSIIAALILVIACINFVNLSTARALRRAREVGVRKAMGAQRSQLVGQFLGESLVTTLLAVALAAGIVALVLPAFRGFIGATLALDAADLPFLAAAAVGLVVVVGLLAGSYPALLMSGFAPIRALQRRTTGAASGAGFRRGLVVFQFAISIFLLVGTLAIHRQLDYVRTARLGIEPEQTVVLPLGDALEGRHDLAKREVAALPGVRAVSAAGTVPARPVSDFLYRPEGWTTEDLPGWDTFFIDDAYADVLGMEIVRGRDFSADLASDSSGFLLNEAAWAAIRQELGEDWADPVGKQLDFYLPGASGWEVFRSGPVIGVVEDFHYASMHATIGPLVLMQAPQTYDALLAKVNADDLTGTLAALEAAWTDLAGATPFDYYFLDDSFDALYRSEQQMGELAGLFAGLALFVACLGLFGLATFMVERRTKEIGIRKVLGARVSSLVSLLSFEYVILVAVAFLIAAPVSYLAVGHWLDGFAYRTDVPWWLFALAGLAAAAIALLTVSTQAVRAASADPVEALRHE